MNIENQNSPTPTLVQDFLENISAHSLWKKQDHLYLACSGGLDSVVLAHLLHASGYDFTILHCNFQLRGEESERDERFVKELAHQLNVAVQIKRFDTQREMELSKKGVQETARILRYKWFNEVVENDAADKNKWILTAHHADDHVETMLIHLFRGTGLAGLQGIKIKSGNLIRPLLFAGRKSLSDYAIYHNLSWEEDSSNAETNYTRNFIRHKVIPSLEEFFPAIKSTMIQSGKRLEEIEMIYQQKVREIKSRLIIEKGQGFAIPVNKLKNVQPLDTLMHEVFSTYGFTTQQIPEIKKLFDAPTGKYISSNQYRVLKNRDWLLIEPVVEHEQDIKIVEEPDAHVDLQTYQLVFKSIATQHQIISNENQATLNLKKLKFPLLVRKWRAGDYFYPLGMKKKKKVSRFMTDLKLTLTEKENQWIVESDKKIVWVVGRRIDERFKIEEQTTERLSITISRQSS
jgi:tRNA(Ile)-lysidine synthase